MGKLTFHGFRNSADPRHTGGPVILGPNLRRKPPEEPEAKDAPDTEERGKGEALVKSGKRPAR